jgi:hypothetical protein
MKYKPEVLKKIDLVNEVLHKLHRPNLLENQDFEIGELTDEFCLAIKLIKAEGIKMYLTLTCYDIQMNIDRLMEAFSISNKDIEKDSKIIINFLYDLLTCHIKIKYCGKHYSELYMINQHGKCIRTLKYISGMYIKLNCTYKESPPIYPFI